MSKSPLCTIMFVYVVGFLPPAAAANPTFECTVTSVHAVAEDGSVVTDTEHLKKQIGSRFSVDKKSGAIRGSYFLDNT
ncbi:MAG: hypothetical protein ACK5UX_15830, partial [Burkholderiales bacterium]